MYKMDSSALKKAMDELGEDLVKGLVKALIDADKVATGNLVRSIDYRLIETADMLIVELLAAPYLKNVDKGRKKGETPPPIAPILKWASVRKIKQYRNKKSGRFISNVARAVIISKGISKNGIKGINVVRKTIDDIYSKKKQLIEKAAGEDLKDMIDKIIIQ